MTPVRPLGPRRRQEGQAPPQQQQNHQQHQGNQGDTHAPVQQQAPPPPPLPEEVDYRDPNAVLGRPKTLLMLWHEYLYGLDGHKPAKDFTPAERGKVKSKYSRRKCFWTVMVKLIRAGYNELSAIDLIHQAYGTGKPVTHIINELQKAKTHGYHPHIGNVIGN